MLEARDARDSHQKRGAHHRSLILFFAIERVARVGKFRIDQRVQAKGVFAHMVHSHNQILVVLLDL